MNFRLRHLFVPLCILFSHVVAAQKIPSSKTNYAVEVENRIREVEQRMGFIKYVIKRQEPATLFNRMADSHIKGLTVAVITNYKVEWAKGYGWADEKAKRPIETTTLFQPGSISKSLNALGVLKLAQDNKINLDSNINIYLRSWKFPYDSISHGKIITVANLLSHTAGLTVHGFPGYYYGDRFPTVPQILDGKKPANTSAVRSQFEPGLRYEYSGGGTMISQLIEMDISGKPYDQYIQETVFAPIGMTSSFFTQPPPEEKRKLLATGYRNDGQFAIKGNYPLLIEQAAGGLWTTPSDLAKYIIEIQLSLLGKSNKVLNQEMTKRMLTPYVDKEAGLGVFVNDLNGTKYFQHSASNQGFTGIYYGSVEGGNGVVVFINADYGMQVIQELVRTIANVYQWNGLSDIHKEVVIDEKTVSDSAMNEYTGLYKEQNGAMAVVSKKDNRLMYRPGGGATWKMYFTSDVDFVNSESISDKHFYREEGKVKGFTRSLDGKELSNAQKVAVMELPEMILDQYAGTYSAGQNQVGKIVIKKKIPWLVADGESKRIYFTSATAFLMSEDTGAEYSIVLDGNGKVTGIKGMARGGPMDFKKVK